MVPFLCDNNRQLFLELFERILIGFWLFDDVLRTSGG